MSATAPATDDVLTWDGSQWAPSAPAAGIEPLAYGFINSDGSVSVSSGNITASTYDSGSGRYEITIAGESYFYNQYVTVVTPGGAAVVENFRVSSGSGNMLVYLRDASNAAVQGDFMFVVYKP